jgi:hypothetical protein
MTKMLLTKAYNDIKKLKLSAHRGINMNETYA